MSEDISSRPPPTRSLILAFVGVGLSFMIATACGQYFDKAISRSSLLITTSAAPSIKNLAGMRVDLRHLQLKTREYVTAAKDGMKPDPAEVGGLWLSLEQKFKAYKALPVLPEEVEYGKLLEQGMARVDQALTRALKKVGSGEIGEAEAAVQVDLARAVHEASEAALAELDFNAAKSEELAREIEVTRSRSMAIAFSLGGLCLLLSIAAGVLTARASRRYSDLLRSHNRLMEKRAEELDLFAGRVAHDILSPLNSVGLALELVKLEAGQDRAVSASLRDGKTSLQRVSLMVNGLLEFARSGAQPSPDARVGVREVIDGVLRELGPSADQAKVDLRVGAFSPCAVIATPAVLTSILSNLISNAIKYIGDGPVRRVTLRLVPWDDRVRFEVEDTGPGIPPDLREKVFQPYLRATHSMQPGFGLGLATVKRLVEAHGGTVGLKSRPGQGCLFWFELRKAAVAEIPLPSVPPAAVKGQGTALRTC